MKNYWIVLIFLRFLIIKGQGYEDSDDIKIFRAKCEDDKAKTGACMYELTTDYEKNIKEYAIFDKCGKGKHCIQENDYYQCLKKEYFKLRKSGQSCNYHEDCYSNSCVSNKCTLASEGERCDSKHGYIGCKAGLYCGQGPDDREIYKCYKYAKEGEDGSKNNCLPGLLIDIDNKCRKYGTLDDGQKVPSYSNLLCKSGYNILTSKDGETFYICASLTTDPTCSKGDVSSEGKVSTKGEWSDKSEIPVNTPCMHATDYTGAHIYYYKQSKLQTKLFQDLLEDYNDLDLDEINSDETIESFTEGFKWKTYEKWLVYKNAPVLYAAGLIDSEGKRKDNKKCEYDFVIKNVLSSHFIKLNTLIIIMIALLF